MAAIGCGDGIEAQQTPREYQIELFENALKRNSIICLKTGSGKTFISVLLIKELQQEIRRPYREDGRRTFFLVPKVALVQQQAEVIRAHTILNVGTYWGSCGVDNWTKEDWESQLVKCEVLVMTTQILLNMLDHGFITMSKINLIVMDECHKAVKNDPLCNIMKHYYKLEDQIKASSNLNVKLPRILGLTASVLHGRCNVCRIPSAIQALETTLRSRIVTADDLETVNRYSTKPVEVCIGYLQPCLSDVDILVSQTLLGCRERIAKTIDKLPLHDMVAVALVNNREHEGRLVSDFEDKKKLLNDLKAYDADEAANIGINIKCSPGYLVNNVMAVYESLGPFATRDILRIFILDLPKFKEDARNLGMPVKANIFGIVEESFVLLFDIIECYLGRFTEKEALLKGASKRVLRLLELLRSYPKASDSSFRGIILVEQRAVAWILSKYLTELARHYTAEYGDFHPCYIVGHGTNLAYTHRTGMDVDDQCLSLMNFKKGVNNLLVGTSVVEEGVDIPECNVVVRFDLPKTFCSYVQSKGRARSQQAIYVLMHREPDKDELAKDLTCYKGLEQELIKISKRNKAKLNDAGLSVNNLNELDAMYQHKTKTGANISLNSAIVILIRYCSSLPHDRFTSLQPTFFYVKDSTNLCKLCSVVRLPSAAAIDEKEIHGALCTDKKTAKKIAAFEACKRLYENGELNDYLLPSQNYIERYQHALGITPLTKETHPKAGTNKRRQTYEKAVAKDLQNCFPFSVGPVYLYAIKMIKPASNEPGAKPYTGPYFGILTSKPITKVIPFQLYGKNSCTAYIKLIEAATELMLDLDSLKEFHHFVFDEVCRITNSLLTFSPECSGCYLIVPLNNNNIDWDLINRCRQYKNGEINGNSLIHAVGEVVVPLYGDSTSKDRRFYVTKICSTLREAQNCSGQDLLKYYDVKYGIKLTQMEQPLLKTDYVPNSLSILNPLIASKAKISPKHAKTNYLVPEVCKVFPLDINQFREAFCLPSVLFRMNGLLLANEFKTTLISEACVMLPGLESEYILTANTLEKLSSECVAKHDVVFLPHLNGLRNLRPDYLLAAVFKGLTTSSANNWDCLERLEVIGDSFLKIAVSICLFCHYSHLHEGGLSTLRTGLVRNFNLVSNAKSIPYILNPQEFQPRFSWLPPGYTISKDLIDSLVNNKIPSHLWTHAEENDLTAGFSENKTAWTSILENRREKAAKSRQIKPNKSSQKSPVVISTSIDESDSESNEDIFFDRYAKHLIGDKTVADSVEAIIGAVLLTCGRTAALRVIHWFGLKILITEDDTEKMDVEHFSETSPFPWKVPELVLTRYNAKMSDKYMDLLNLEKKLGYTFHNKGLLMQAVIHPTFDCEAVDNYQKLEFLGDAVLDYLVTMHLYQNKPNISPGDMTDLRSSIVDNCTFAYLAVKNDFHKVMRYRSSLLFSAIDTYLHHHKNLRHPKDSIYMIKENDAISLEEIEVPKALGDIFESIAGAIFLDSGLSLIHVWKVFQPLLEEVMNKYSEALPINPIRCVMERFPNAVFSTLKKTGSGSVVDVSINGHTYSGSSSKKKLAKVAAAKNALRSLNISSVRNLS